MFKPRFRFDSIEPVSTSCLQITKFINDIESFSGFTTNEPNFKKPPV